MTISYLDPVEQRARILVQIEKWRERHRKRPSHLLDVQIAALLRLVDRLDDLIDGCRLERPETVPAAVPGASEAPAADRCVGDRAIPKTHRRPPRHGKSGMSDEPPPARIRYGK